MARKLEVEILGDASSLQRAFATADKSASGFGSGIANVAKTAAFAAGAAGIGAIAVTLKAGIGEWEQSAKVAAQTEAVIKSTGGSANVTAGQVDALATSIMNKSGIDDEAIKSGENMLLTFTNIHNEVGKGNDIFNQATSVITDMDVAMTHGNTTAESMSKTSILVGKALNDPIKGISALSRVGVTFTEGQKETIKALVKSGDTMKAQKIIVAELTKEFGGSAKALGDTMPGQINKLKESFNNLAGGIVGSLAPAFADALGSINKFMGEVGKAHGFTAKIKVAATLIWEGLEKAAGELRQKLSEVLFGKTIFGPGMMPIKVDPGLITKIGDAFKNLNWAAVGKSVIDGLINAMKETGELAKSIADTVMNAVRKINWEGVGRVMGPGLATAITVAFTTLMDPAFWARNWDLALSIALVAFGGPISKLGGKLLAPFARLGGEMLVALSDSITRLAPRLADAFNVAINMLGRAAEAGFQGIVRLGSAVLGTLEGFVRGLFGKLGGLAVLAIKVLGINAAIDAIAQFAGKVGGWFAEIGRTIFGAFKTAWDNIKRGALVAALAVVEPFSHLPSKLGGWARSAKDAIQAQLDAVDASKVGAAIINDFRLGIKPAGRAGQDIGAAYMAGIAAGIGAAEASAMAASVGAINKVIAAGKDAAKAKSPSQVTMELGKDLMKGVSAGIINGVPEAIAAARTGMTKITSAMLNVTNTLGSGLTKLILASFKKAADAADKGSKDLGKSMIKGLSPVGEMIVAAAKKWGIDARAALAVAMTEGGLKFGGKAGDSGQSFGPFQMATFGELSGKTAAQARKFADSVEGINFALRRMAQEGAKGLSGLAAMKQIIGGPGWGFERPANAAAELQKAIGYYKQFGTVAVEAVTQAGPKITAAQMATLTGLGNLVKQYAPIIGLEHAKGIIAGMFQGEPGVVAQAKQLLEEAHKAQLQKIKDAKDAFKGAFGDLATAALAAFDAKMAAWKPPSSQLLDAFKLQDQINQMTAGLGPAVTEAQARLNAAFASGNAAAIKQAQDDLNAALTNSFNAVNANTMNLVNANAAALDQAQAEGDPEKIATAQAAYDKALTDRTAALEQNNADQRALVESNLQYRADAEQRTHDAIAAKQREGLAKQFVQLQTWLLKHPAQWAEMGAKVQKILSDKNIQIQNAGTVWADKLAAGIRAGIPAVVSAAHALASAWAAAHPSTHSPLKPAKEGPLAFHPYEMGKQWAAALGSGLSAGGLPTAMAGMSIGGGGTAALVGGGGAPVVNVYVGGSVVTENQLVDAVYRGLVRKSGRNSGNLGLA